MQQSMQQEVMLPLNDNEKKIFNFLEDYFSRHDKAPTFTEIKRHFQFASYNSVQRYLDQLERKKYIYRPRGNQKRAIVLLKRAPSQNLVMLPFLGRVAAGQPIEELHDNETVAVPPLLVREAHKSFTLEVKGQSMIGDGIFDGDIIIVQEQAIARNGEIVVAILNTGSANNEATVKRYYFHSGAKLARPQVELRPANPDFESLFCSPEKVQIRGIVVGLMRRY